MEIDILALSNLIQECSKNETTETPTKTNHKISPAFFYQNQSTHIETSNIAGKSKEDKDAIWGSDEEVNDKSKSFRDPRPQPRYEIYYKQNVGTEDIFMKGSLQSGSLNCSHIVVKVHFPMVKSTSELEVDLKTDTITVTSRER